jgi:hypothetical protein
MAKTPNKIDGCEKLNKQLGISKLGFLLGEEANLL